MDQKKQFDEIAATFEEKCAGNQPLLDAINSSKQFFNENYARYERPTLAGTLSCMWYCAKGNDAGDNSLMRDCLGAIQQVAKGATFKA